MCSQILGYKDTFADRRGWVCRTLCIAVIFALTATACRRQTDSRPANKATTSLQTSAACLECHATQFGAWRETDHARANRPVHLVADAKALATFQPPVGIGPGTTPDLVLGSKPLWQPLLPAPGGRWQPHELAFDSVKKEWFNVFGTEERRPGEWGHWTGRGMNWNSMCAQCHMTGYRKNYDAANDTYKSTWIEHGVGCIQCHGPTKPGHGAKNAVGEISPAPHHGDRQKMMQTCAPCHARNEQLRLNFQPGDDYDDHYRVALPVEPEVFWPDGQQRDEDFNWTSVLLSRMGHAGVTCMDCHDPHTTKTLFPSGDNQLCLQCHATPGRVQPNGTRAIPIDPGAHSHHAMDSAGNSCVACHMPTTNYMQRAPRHDHGWLKPDPLLTKELGIPNACSRCHSDRTIDWVIQAAESWYGPKFANAQRVRTRAVAAAQAGNPTAVGSLLALLGAEQVPAWRATYLDLLAPFDRTAPVLAMAASSLTAQDALERAAAVRLLTGHASSREKLRPLLKDPVRLVRLDAAWAFSSELAPDSSERKELDAYLALSLDQPGGRFRLGQDLANRGRLGEAEREMTRAAEWDPYSPGIHDAHGFVLSGVGKPFEAAAAFLRAAQLRPYDAQTPYRAALAYAEAGRLREAENALRLAVERDPRFDRAWYNLGLLLAQVNRFPQSVEALQHAEKIAPTVADYPYALATVLLRTGDTEGARAAARRALAVDPENAAALHLLRGQ